MGLRRLIGSIAILLLTCAASTFAALAAGAVFPGAELTFVSNHDGPDDLYTLDVDRGIMLNLTRRMIAYQRKPRWSPDGSQLAFMSYFSWKSRVYVMNADGSGLRRLAETRSEDVGLLWSPDGRQLAVSDHIDVYILDPQSSVAQLPVNIASPAHHSSSGIAGWLNDERFYFAATSSPREVFLMDTSGSAIQLTSGDAEKRTPRLSPDGRWLAFVAEQEGSGEIYLMEVCHDDSRLAQYPSKLRDFLPAVMDFKSGRLDCGSVTARAVTPAYRWAALFNWSPDSRWLAFSAFDDDRKNELYLLDTRHDNAVWQLTDNSAVEIAFEWSPDGRYMAYMTRSGQESGLYLVDVNQMQPRFHRPLADTVYYGGLAWRP